MAEVSPEVAALLRQTVLTLVDQLHELDQTARVDRPKASPQELQQMLYDIGNYLVENVEAGAPICSALGPPVLAICRTLLGALNAEAPLEVLRPFVLNFLLFTEFLLDRLQPVVAEIFEPLVDFLLATLVERPGLVPPRLFERVCKTLSVYMEHYAGHVAVGTAPGDRIFEVLVGMLSYPWAPEEPGQPKDERFNWPLRAASLLADLTNATSSVGGAELVYTKLMRTFDGLVAEVEELGGRRDETEERRRRAQILHVSPPVELQSAEGRTLVAAALLGGIVASCVNDVIGFGIRDKLWAVYARVFGGVPDEGGADASAVDEVHVEVVPPAEAEAAAAAAAAARDEAALREAAARMSGYMEKRGAINPAFKKRWFSFTLDARGQPQLVYAAGPGNKAKGAVSLKGAAVLKEAPGAKGDRTDLQWAVRTSQRTFVLRCATAQEKEAWIDAARRLMFQDAERHALDAHPSARRSRAQSRAVRAPARPATRITLRTRYDGHVMWAAGHGFHNFLTQCKQNASPETIANLVLSTEELMTPVLRALVADPLWFAVQHGLVKSWVTIVAGYSKNQLDGTSMDVDMCRLLVPAMAWAARHASRAHKTLLAEDVDHLYFSDIADCALLSVVSDTLLDCSKAPSLFVSVPQADAAAAVAPLLSLLDDDSVHLEHRPRLAMAAANFSSIFCWTHRLVLLPSVVAVCVRVLDGTAGMPVGPARCVPREFAYICLHESLRRVGANVDPEEDPAAFSAAAQPEGAELTGDPEVDAAAAAEAERDAAALAAAAAHTAAARRADLDARWKEALDTAVGDMEARLPALMRHIDASLAADYGIEAVTKREAEELERQRLARENPEAAAAQAAQEQEQQREHNAAEAEALGRRRASSQAGRNGLAAAEAARGGMDGAGGAGGAAAADDDDDDGNEVSGYRLQKDANLERREVLSLVARLLFEEPLAGLFSPHVPRTVKLMSELMLVDNGDLQYGVAIALVHLHHGLPEDKRWRAGAVNTVAQDPVLKPLVVEVCHRLLTFSSGYPNMLVATKVLHALSSLIDYAGPVAIVGDLDLFTALVLGILDRSAVCVHPEVRSGKTPWADQYVEMVCAAFATVGRAATVCGPLYLPHWRTLEPKFADIIADGTIPIIVGADLMMGLGLVVGGLKDKAEPDFAKWLGVLLPFTTHNDYRVVQSSISALGAFVHALGPAATGKYNVIFDSLLRLLFGRAKRNRRHFGIMNPEDIAAFNAKLIALEAEEERKAKEAAEAAEAAGAAEDGATAPEAELQPADRPAGRERAKTLAVPFLRAKSTPAQTDAERPKAQRLRGAAEESKAAEMQAPGVGDDENIYNEEHVQFRTGACDNALTVVAKMILRSPQSIDLAQATPLLIKGLPLQRNLIGTNFTVTAVIKLVNLHPEAVKPVAHDLVRVLAMFLEEPSVKPQMLPGLRRMCKVVAERHPEAAENIAGRLSDSTRAAWEAALSS